MSLAEGDIAFAKELFAGISGLTTKRMFGGMAFYAEGTIFALLRSDGCLLLKAEQEGFVHRLAAMGSKQWTYTRKTGVSSSMPYWTLPDALLDDPDGACDLAREALDHLI